LFGSYTRVDYNANATALICGAQAAGGVLGGAAYGVTSCNPDFNIWQVGTRTAWTPVQNLTFSAEGMYTFLDQKNVGTITTAAAAGVKPANVYEYKDQGMWSGNIRVRRTW